MPEHQMATMSRTMNIDLSFATNVRAWNAGYVIAHVRVRNPIRTRLGLSKPRNSGFGRGGGFSTSVCWEFVVDGGGEVHA